MHFRIHLTGTEYAAGRTVMFVIVSTTAAGVLGCMPQTRHEPLARGKPSLLACRGAKLSPCPQSCRALGQRGKCRRRQTPSRGEQYRSPSQRPPLPATSVTRIFHVRPAVRSTFFSCQINNTHGHEDDTFVLDRTVPHSTHHPGA